jgi:hypothetical protein
MNSIWKCGLALAVLFSLTAHAEWERLADIPPPGQCYPGSGMVYGPMDGTEYIWLLYGTSQERGYLACYDIAEDTWYIKARMPQDPETGWGGALAYVPDPYAEVPDGSLFAFKGNNSSQFWLYAFGTDEWIDCPPLTDTAHNEVPVSGGGALCFGGYGYHEGLGYAYVYAFCGGGCEGFFRYRFGIVPHDEDGGKWEQMPGLNQLVDEGGALVWCEMPESPTYTKGLVYAIRGDDSYGLYRYNPLTDVWDHVTNMEWDVGGGGALAPGPNGSSFFGFFGNSGREWFYHNAVAGSFVYFDEGDSLTWDEQRSGAAIAYDGDYVYGELGRTDGEFRRYEYPESFGGGGQGHPSALAGALTVSVQPGPGAHTFLVTGMEQGPVRLQIVDAGGRVCHSAVASVRPDRAAVVWNHEGAAPGVYFYRVTSGDMQATGKLTVVE